MNIDNISESYSFCEYLQGKDDEGVLLYNNSLLDPTFPTYYVLKFNTGGKTEEIVVPKQKEDQTFSQCIIRDTKSVYFLTQLNGNKPFKLEIIDF